MARQPETEHRFRIICEATKGELGEIIAALTILGVTKIDHELITDIKTFKMRTPRATPEKTKPAKPSKVGKGVRFDVPNKDLIAKYIRNKKSFALAELRKLFRDEGRKANSISPIVNTMANAKVIKVTPTPGVYRVMAKAKTKPPVVTKQSLNGSAGASDHA